MSTTAAVRTENRSSLWLLGALLVIGGLAGPWNPLWNALTPGAAIAVAHREPAATVDPADENLLSLSPQATETLGIQTGMVALSTFRKPLTIPGMVVLRPGKTQRRVTTHLEGIIKSVNVEAGEAIELGRPLFRLRLTQEHVLNSQGEFLKLLEDLDVVDREVRRLEPLVTGGSTPQKTLLEQQYLRQKLQAAAKTARETLRLHDFTEPDIRSIETQRQLRSEFTEILGAREGEVGSAASLLLTVETLDVRPGQFVNPGDPLMTLVDYSSLFVEGNAFEQDAPRVLQAMRRGWKVEARARSLDGVGEDAIELAIRNMSDEVDSVSRTTHFYCEIANTLVRDERVGERRFVNWRFKPGERLTLRVPVEEWNDCIVLPAAAVAQDGAESFVFRKSRHRWRRRPVHVLHRDPFQVVIANDGSILPGNTVAMSSADQLLLAMKIKSNGEEAGGHHGHVH